MNYTQLIHFGVQQKTYTHKTNLYFNKNESKKIKKPLMIASRIRNNLTKYEK